MASLEIKISVTDVEPMKSYIEEMDSIVAFLHSKTTLNPLEQKVVDSHERFIEQLENESDDEFIKPYLAVVRK